MRHAAAPLPIWGTLSAVAMAPGYRMMPTDRKHRCPAVGAVAVNGELERRSCRRADREARRRNVGCRIVGRGVVESTDAETGDPGRRVRCGAEDRNRGARRATTIGSARTIAALRRQRMSGAGKGRPYSADQGRRRPRFVVGVGPDRRLLVIQTHHRVAADRRRHDHDGGPRCVRRCDETKQ